MTERMGELLKKATVAGSDDEARVMASVLNNDLLAMSRFEGRNAFTAADAMRVSRIMAEYQKMATGTVESLGSDGRFSRAALAPLDFK